MFLEALKKKNAAFIEAAFDLHKEKIILPDTFLLDADAILENAEKMLRCADKFNIEMYFMLKQFGRNPYIAKKLSEMGFAGCVCVDFREALLMIENQVLLGNVGHLVQTPIGALEAVIAHKPDVMTVYSLEKIKEIDNIAESLGVKQRLLLRVVSDDSFQYAAQNGGIRLCDLEKTANHISKLKNVEITGVCSFPCILFDEETSEFAATPNCTALLEAEKLLNKDKRENFQINMPSATCIETIPMIKAHGGTHGEPGHGLSGTTPKHAVDFMQPEKPAMLYVSEISHNYMGKAYCYGGGYYRRGHLRGCLTNHGSEFCNVQYLDDSAGIDYYLELDRECPVSQAVVMGFRSQIFATRSEVAVVTGISKGMPCIEGIYSSTGIRLKAN